MASLTYDLTPDAAPQAPTPGLDLAGLAVTAQPAPTHRKRGLRIALSATLHAVAIGAFVVIPLLGRSEMPEPAHGINVFFAVPTIAPPPPPPPPAAPKRALAVTRIAPRSDAQRFVAPIAVPSDFAPSDGLDLGIDGGVAGGVEGGVAGGVVGGVVGGLVDVAPVVKPVRVGGEIGEPRKLKHVDPVYPFIARSARIEGIVVIECTIGIDGRVEAASVVRSVPLLDDAALAAVRQWRYTPTLYRGIPVPALMTVKVGFSLSRAG